MASLDGHNGGNGYDRGRGGGEAMVAAQIAASRRAQVEMEASGRGHSGRR